MSKSAVDCKSKPLRKTPIAGESCIILHREGKHISVVVSLPLESILTKTSRYDAGLPDSVVSFISSSSGNIK
jgi:hypothetical protein